MRADAAAMTRPANIFSGRWKRPTRLEGWQEGLGANGESCSGTLWVAPAEYAVCEHWNRAARVTLSWEALGGICKHRYAITEAVKVLCREVPQLTHMTWCHVEWDRNQMRASTAFERIWRELSAGGVVVCWCVQGQHRSPGSLIAFFMSYLGMPFAKACDMVKQHGNCKIEEYIQLDALQKLTVRRHVQVHAVRAAAEARVEHEAAVARAAAIDLVAPIPNAKRSSRAASVPCRGRNLTADILDRRHFENTGIPVYRQAYGAVSTVEGTDLDSGAAEPVPTCSGSALSGQQVAVSAASSGEQVAA